MYYYKKISFCEVFESVTWNGVKKVAMIWPRKYKRGQLKKHVFFPTSMCSALISFLIRSSLFYPPLPTYSILLNSSVCNSCIFQGWKRTLIKAFFQPIRKIEIFHTRCFFLINEIRLLGDHPLATGVQGFEHPFYGRLRCFVDSDELSKFPGKSPTELTAPPYREEWQLFVATLLFTILCSFVLPPPSQQKSICHETFLWFIHPSSVFATVWKFRDFSVTQILREINFGDCIS